MRQVCNGVLLCSSQDARLSTARVFGGHRRSITAVSCRHQPRVRGVTRCDSFAVIVERLRVERVSGGHSACVIQLSCRYQSRCRRGG